MDGKSARISFAKPRTPVEAPVGTTLMQALLNGGMAVASSCGGDGVCTKCLVRVVDGANHLSAPNDRERVLRERHQFAKDQRVSCQTRLLGDVTLDTGYW